MKNHRNKQIVNHQQHGPIPREQERVHIQMVRQALAFHLSGDIGNALDAYDRAIAIRPDFAAAHNGRGAVLQLAGRNGEALAAFNQAIAIDPTYADAHYHRGVVLLNSGRYEEALAAFDRALALKPAYATAHKDRGVVLQRLGKYEEALAAFDCAIVIKPGYAEAHFNRGLALQQSGRYEEALAAFDCAIAVKPAYADVHYHRGVTLRKLKRYEDAIPAFDRAIAFKPTSAEAHFNRGFALQELTRNEEALLSYDRALALNAEYPAALWNKSLLLLLKGDFEEGWRLYEWRHEVMKQFTRRFAEPLLQLDREEAKGRTVLLYAEQGLGDAIQMLRYVPLLAARGFQIIAEVPDALLSLAGELPGITLAVQQGQALPAFDLQCPLMSLPLIFKTQMETIPAAAPYLTIPREKLTFWKDRLGKKTRPRIGLVWSGGKQHENDCERSIPFLTLLPLLAGDAEFHSLQKEYRETDTEMVEINKGRLRDHAGELIDFGDTAALIEEMDLVISVDTAVAHLAGALGKPVWILLPYAPDFRWLQTREDSPWYPTARLFRQPAFNTWDIVVENLNNVLAHSLGSD